MKTEPKTGTPRHFWQLHDHDDGTIDGLPVLAACGPTPGYFTRSLDGCIEAITGDALENLKADRGPAPHYEAPEAYRAPRPEDF